MSLLVPPPGGCQARSAQPENPASKMVLKRNRPVFPLLMS